LALVERPTKLLRVFRCFAFIDLCEFTELDDRFGDDAAVAELRGLRNTVRAEATNWGVRVDKWLGDGVMLVGVEIEPLLRSVVAIFQGVAQQGTLPLHGGVAGGPVILMEGDDYVGRIVNVASRLCDAAGPGEFLCTQEMAAEADWLPVGGKVAERVKGYAAPIPAVVVRP
jgi:adenylate cyclase